MPRKVADRRCSTAKRRSSISISSIGMVTQLGGIREFTVKRAPREALLRGLGGDATRQLYTLGWQEIAAAGDERALPRAAHGTWLIAGFDELAADLPGCIPVDRDRDGSGVLAAAVRAGCRSAVRRSPASSGAARGTPSAEESSAEFAARLESEIANAAHRRAHAAGAARALKLTGGLWIITERAVATESGEPVDPVQAALWGLGRTIIAEQPTLRCRLVDLRRIRRRRAVAGRPTRHTRRTNPNSQLRQGKFLVPRLLPWARSGHLAVPRATDYVLAPTERGAIDNLRLTETDSRRTRRGPGAGPGGGRRPQLPGCAQRARPVSGRSGAGSAVTSAASSRSWVRRHRIRGRPTGFRLHAGIVRQPGQCAGSVAGAGAERDRAR